MSNQSSIRDLPPPTAVEHVTELSPADVNDLCDATDEAIKAGGGFGWVKLPARDILERYWQGVMAMPTRMLFVARLDSVICGSAQISLPPRNNEAQSHAVTLTGNFIVPWARGHGLARSLLGKVEKKILAENYSVINLDVRETQEAAIKLYESCGYRKIGYHPCYARIEDKMVGGYYYYKQLTPNDL